MMTSEERSGRALSGILIMLTGSGQGMPL